MKDSRSPEAYKVPAGDVLTQSVRYVPEDNSYDMFIASAVTGQSISWNYALEARQGDVPETTAYIVVEHQPRKCAQFPASGFVQFSDMYVEVEYLPVTPAWVAMQESPACGSEAVVLDTDLVSLTWDVGA